MSIKIEIDDDELKGFSDAAKDSLRNAVSTYASDIIEESNRIEVGRGSVQGDPEVTRGMVDDAVLLFRRGLGTPKKSAQILLIRIAAALLPLFVGLLYDPAALQDSGYMLLFVLVVAGAILTVTISVLKE